MGIEEILVMHNGRVSGFQRVYILLVVIDVNHIEGDEAFKASAFIRKKEI